MRALVLILSCVILLAVIQGTYHIVAAHRPHRDEVSSIVTDDADEATRHNHAGDQHKTHRNRGGHNREPESITETIPVPKTETEEPKPTISKSRTFLSRNHGHRKLCRSRPELCEQIFKYRPETDDDVKTGRGLSKARKEHRKGKETRQKSEPPKVPPVGKGENKTYHTFFELTLKKQPETPRQMLIPVQTSLDQNKPDATNDTDRTDVIGKEKHGDKYHVTSLYDQMLGDASRDRNMGGRRRGDRGQDRGNNPKKGRGRKGRKGNPAGKKDRGGKKHKKKTAPGSMCESNMDCGEGKCCIARRSGRTMCRAGSIIDEGQRCKDSCMCREGLQCFVREVNRRGKKKSRVHGRVIGRCANPVQVNLDQGYFLPVTPTAAPSDEEL